MKKAILLSLLSVAIVFSTFAQISYGGKPLPFVSTRASETALFETMPEFDVEEELRIDEINESDLRSGFRFAYKFMTDFHRSNSGVSYTLADGTRVWRLGIRSENAYSINVLFTEYELPEGACLFLYNKDQSHILGSFDYRNNSDLQILPTAPVMGDEIIIEYQEPPNVSFSGRLRIGEVNHAYRDLRVREPGDTRSAFACMPSPLCYEDESDKFGEQARSAVLLIINGVTGCSGSLINNTANNGKPYLLTASHCVTRNFTLEDPEEWEFMAGSIVTFFNYDSPLCETVLRGTEEQSMASSYIRSINLAHDMVLLELLEVPPISYRPYYTGWNAAQEVETDFPFYNIHHPEGSVKRIGVFENELQLTSYDAYGFADDAHWFVSEWTVGCTAGGSSGSPLFDKNWRLIGALTGGNSYCSSPTRDYFYALSKAWEPDPLPGSQLKYWLDLSSNGQLVCDGLDPYANAPAYRLSNVGDSGKRETATLSIVSDTDSRYVFGNRDDITQFVEAYDSKAPSFLQGVYMVTHSAGGYSNMEVEVVVYEGSNKPGTLLHKEIFRPTYTGTDSGVNDFIETVKTLTRTQESFVRFTESVGVNGDFYIGYRIVSAPSNAYIAAINLPAGETTRNTTWVFANSEWQEASERSDIGYATSLYIDPVISYKDYVKVEAPDAGSLRFIFDPTSQLLSVMLPEGVGEGRLTLTTIDGKIVGAYPVSVEASTVRLNSYQQGVYIATIVCGNTYYTGKIFFK